MVPKIKIDDVIAQIEIKQKHCNEGLIKPRAILPYFEIATERPLAHLSLIKGLDWHLEIIPGTSSTKYDKQEYKGPVTCIRLSRTAFSVVRQKQTIGTTLEISKRPSSCCRLILKASHSNTIIEALCTLVSKEVRGICFSTPMPILEKGIISISAFLPHGLPLNSDHAPNRRSR